MKHQIDQLVRSYFFGCPSFLAIPSPRYDMNLVVEQRACDYATCDFQKINSQRAYNNKGENFEFWTDVRPQRKEGIYIFFKTG